jgi:hypothetical protein
MEVAVPQVVADRELMFAHLRQHGSNRVPKSVPMAPELGLAFLNCASPSAHQVDDQDYQPYNQEQVD